MNLNGRFLTSISLVLAMLGAFAQNPDFKWLDHSRDAALFQEIQTAFAAELTPDALNPESQYVPNTVKFIDRIALRGDAALVLIAEKENQASPFVVFRAFSFDLRNKVKTPIGGKNISVFWMWRLEKVAHLTPADDTDIVFQFLDCTECEAVRLLGAFHYSPAKRMWELRQWSKEDGPWLMIGSDRQYADEGAYLYDCLHVITSATRHGLDNIAVRCRESLQPDLEKPAKRVTKDETLLYLANKDGQLTRSVIDRRSEEFNAVQAALCGAKPASPLCRKSAAVTKGSASPR